MRKLCSVVAGALIGCGGDTKTAPEPAPWYDGTWRATSLNGAALPQTVSGVRYDSLTLSVIRFDLSLFSYYAQSGGREAGCGGVVNVLFYPDTVRIMAPQALNTCTFLQVTGRNFVRAGDSVLHHHDGLRWVLKKSR